MYLRVTHKNSDGYWPSDEFVGFTKLAELEWRNYSYEFDITGVWVLDSDGTLWTADDSGCSCPTPWENIVELKRLFSIEPLESRYRDEMTDEYRGGSVNADEWLAFKAKVEEAFAALAKR